MATDNTVNQTETANTTSTIHESDVEQVHLTQSGNAPVQVQVPQGANVVRVQVTPGETVELPFPTDALVARLGDNGNLAVKVGDITVILVGYADATGQEDIKIIGNDGKSVDVAAVLASTDPNLDIQTAAGPGAGDQGTGVDNNGGVFTPFDPNGGIGGLNAIGGLQATDLQYNLIQRERIIFEVNDEIDTAPQIISIKLGSPVNEDDLSGGEGNAELSAKVFEDHPSHVLDDLGDKLGGSFTYWGFPYQQGNDPFDTTDHEEGSQQPNLPDDSNGAADGGVDQDREPLTTTAVVTVDFLADVPGHLSFVNGGNAPIVDQLAAMNLTSHGNVLQFVILPGSPDTDPNDGIDDSYGETLVAYYLDGEGGSAVVVFTIAIREFDSAAAPADFDIDFTIYGVVDNVPGIADAIGDITDALDIGVPFFVVDSNGTVTPAPDGALVFTDIDDTPSLGSLCYDWVNLGGEGEGGWAYVPVHIKPSDTDIVHDETPGVQPGNSQDDVNPNSNSWPDYANYQRGEALAAAGLPNNTTLLGMAAMHVTVSFGADGAAQGNKEAGKTIFTGDNDAYSQAYQLYLGTVDAPATGGTTNWKITENNVVLDVKAEQVDANTIVGYAEDGEGNRIEVFVLRIDPNSGEVVILQLHQVNQADGANPDDPTPSLLVNGQPVNFAGTDFDGDHVTSPLQVVIQDDGPKAYNDYAKVDETHDTDPNTPGTQAGVTGNLITGVSNDGVWWNNSTGDKLSVDHNHTIPQIKYGDSTLVIDFVNGTVQNNGAGAGDDGDDVSNVAYDPVTGVLSFDTPHGHFSVVVKSPEVDNDTIPNSTDTNELGYYEYTPKPGTSSDKEHHGLPTNANGTDLPAGANDSAKILNILQSFGSLTLSNNQGGTDNNANNWGFKEITAGGKTYSGIAVGGGIDGGETDTDGNSQGPVAETITIKFPSDTDAAKITLGALFDGQLYDSGNAEAVKWEAWDGNQKVGEGVVYGGYNGLVSFFINTGHDFDTVKLTPLDNGAGHNGNNTDFLLVGVDTCDDLCVQEKIEYTLKDGDGDTSKATLTIDVQDGEPKITSCEADLNITIDEDGLAGGNYNNVNQPTGNSDDVGGDNGPGDSDGSEATAKGHISYNTYTDGLGAVFLSSNSNIQTLDGKSITWAWDPSNNRLVGYATPDTDRIVVEVKVTNAGNGGFDFEVILHEPLDHPSNSSEDNLYLDIKATVADKDCDIATANIHVKIDDDTPSIERTNVSVPSLRVDESDLNVNSTASFAALFSSVAGADGQAGKIAYALSVKQQGVDSGVNDTQSGHNVYLFLENGVVVGREGTSPQNAQNGDVVFKVSVDNNGNVTLDQVRAVEHDDTHDPDESNSPTGLSAADLIKLKATITDNDGDKDDATVDIGNSLKFEDDGPSIKASGASLPKLTVDETFLNGDDTKSFSGVFFSNGGADGQEGPIAYALSVKQSGVDSGVNDTLTGNNVYLFLENGVVVGREGTSPQDAQNGDVVFKVSVDSNGNVKLDQVRSVEHDNPNDPDEANGPTQLSASDLIVLKATITDGDGDKADASVNIGKALNFEDDGPLINVKTISAPTLTVDETFLNTDDTKSFAGMFQSSGGADGQEGPIAYALSVKQSGVDSGVNDTLTGNNVYLFLENGVVVGREGTSPQNAQNGDVVFKVSVDSNGNVKLDQVRSVEHDNPNDPDEANGPTQLSASDLIVLKATITDGDGDKADASLNIGKALNFEDDGPLISLKDVSIPKVLVDDTTLNTNTSASFSALFQSNGGADGQEGPIAYALSVKSQGVDSGVKDTATGHNVYLFLENGEVVGREGTSAQTAQNGAVVFKVTVNGSGEVTLDQVRAVVHDNPNDPNEANGPTELSAADLIKLKATITDGDGDKADSTANIGKAFGFLDDGPAANNDGLYTVITITPGTGNNQHELSGNVITGAESQANGVSGADTVGNDTPGQIVSIKLGNGQVINLTDAGADVDCGGIGTLHINKDGSWTFDQTGTTSQTFNFTYVLKDGDGDTDDATFSITTKLVQNPPSWTFASANVDEDGLTGGFKDDVNAVDGQPGDNVTGAGGGDSSEKTFGGVFSDLLDGDNITDLSLAGNVPADFSAIKNINGVAVDSVVVSQDGHTLTASAGGIPLFQVEVGVGGATYKVTLLNPVQHSNSASEDEVSTTVKVSATNAGGTTAAGIVITIDDDRPVVTQSTQAGPSLAVDETNSYGSPDTKSVAGLFNNVNFGADGAAAGGGLAYSLTGANGQPIGNGTPSGLTDLNGTSINLYNENGNIVGRVGGANGIMAFQVSINGSNVTLQQVWPIKHVAGDSNDNLTSTLNQIYVTLKATDKDGDVTQATSSNALTLNFRDDGPAAGGNASIVLDDDNQANGNDARTPGTGDNAAQNATGTLAHSYGTDGAGTTLLTDAMLPGTGNFTQSLTNGGKLLTILQDGVAVLTITLNNDTAGGYTVAQLKPIRHPDGLNENDVEFVINYVVKDGDGDTTPGTVNLKIDDDVPIVVDDTDTVTTFGVAETGNVLANDFVGADTPGTVVSYTVNGNTYAADGASHVIPTGTISMNADGSYTYTQTSGAAGSFVVSYTMQDSDKDQATGTLTMTTKDQPIQNFIVVGENANDGGTGDQPTHRIDNTPGNHNGDIVGDAGNDVLIGDVGGKTSITEPGKTYSIALVCDTSSSMSTDDRMGLMKDAVSFYVNNLPLDGNITIRLISFGSVASVETTVTLTAGNLNSLLQQIDDLETGQNNGGSGTAFTNYEAALTAAKTFMDGQPAGNEKLVYFITDGVPTAYNGDTNGNGDGDTDVAEITPALAAINAWMVANASVKLNAIGIDVDANTLGLLNFFDNTTLQSGTQTKNVQNGSVTDNYGQATNITTASQLKDALLGGGGTKDLVSPVGNDLITGGAGNDAILGDSVFAGSADLGWAKYLADHPGLSAEQIRADIYANLTTGNHSYAAEGTVGGHDTINAGAGNDYVYGQAGNDIIHGDADNDQLFGGSGNDQLFGDAGDDVLDGGTGNDILDGGIGTDIVNGGVGDDTIVWHTGHDVDGGTNTSNDLSGTNLGDILDISGLPAGTVDLTSAIVANQIDGIETIRMTGGGNHTLVLSAQDVLDVGTGEFNPSGNTWDNEGAVKVEGNNGDVLKFAENGWSEITNSINNEPAGFRVFVHDSNPGGNITEDAYVLVQSNLIVQDNNGNIL